MKQVYIGQILSHIGLLFWKIILLPWNLTVNYRIMQYFETMAKGQNILVLGKNIINRSQFLFRMMNSSTRSLLLWKKMSSSSSSLEVPFETFHTPTPTPLKGSHREEH